MPFELTRISRLAGPSCKSILYCSSEQPPPTTATRRTPCSLPCFCRRELTVCAAVGVTLIKRSSPTRKGGGAWLELLGAIIDLEPILLSWHRQPAGARGDEGHPHPGHTANEFRECGLVLDHDHDLALTPRPQ